MNTDELLTTTAAAKYLAVSKAFLERDRWAGPTIVYIKVGSRAVRYRLEDLQAFINARAMRAPADAARAGGARLAAHSAAS